MIRKNIIEVGGRQGVDGTGALTAARLPRTFAQVATSLVPSKNEHRAQVICCGWDGDDGGQVRNMVAKELPKLVEKLRAAILEFESEQVAPIYCATVLLQPRY